ncbi:hypothetical protein QP178_18970 [Sphingomonas aurantiaca]|uniref:hypothetical protein n=1 Tax=Sphingomonas aurantiaca TaxID=185949 RepID=UPI002FE3F4C5
MLAIARGATEIARSAALLDSPRQKTLRWRAIERWHDSARSWPITAGSLWAAANSRSRSGKISARTTHGLPTEYSVGSVTSSVSGASP